MLQKYPLNTFEAHQNKQNFNCAKKNISDFIVFGPWIGAAWRKYRILFSEMNTINKSENKQNSETNENYYAFKFIWMVLLQSNMATARTHSFIHSFNQQFACTFKSKMDLSLIEATEARKRRMSNIQPKYLYILSNWDILAFKGKKIPSKSNSNLYKVWHRNDSLVRLFYNKNKLILYTYATL